VDQAIKDWIAGQMSGKSCEVVSHRQRYRQDASGSTMKSRRHGTPTRVWLASTFTTFKTRVRSSPLRGKQSLHVHDDEARQRKAVNDREGRTTLRNSLSTDVYKYISDKHRSLRRGGDHHSQQLLTLARQV